MAKDSQYWKRRQNTQLGRVARKATRTIRNPSVANMARTAWSGVKYIRTLINSEVMKFDQGPGSTSISTTPQNLYDLTAIAQGDGIAQRTGQSILNNGFYINLAFTKHASATFSFIRVVLVQDRQQISDTAPTYSDVFESNSTYAKVNPNTMGRFKIWYDKRVLLSTQRDFKQINIYRKFKGIHTRYNGTASSDIQKNGFYLMLVSSEATNTPTVVSASRTYYHDN